jgi:hypothetical protein
MRFRLITTSIIDAEPILIKYPQLKDKVEIVDGDAYVEVESAEELMEFAKLSGEIVVGEDFIGTKEPFIEIYDGYRE